jgi:hypothetical protein
LVQMLRSRGKTLPILVATRLLRKSLVEEDDGSSRHLQFGQEHRPLFVEMRNELVAIVFDFLDQRGERVGPDARCRVKVGLEAVGIFNDAPPVVLGPAVAVAVGKQFASLQHGYVEEVPMSLTPERGLRVLWVEQFALHFDVPTGTMEGQIAHEAAT